jgi:hypothetical protein
VDRSLLLRAAAVQAVAVAVAAAVLGGALPRSFFVSWGWLAGPAVWAACAALTAAALRLPLGRTLVGAALAGLPALVAVPLGVHWLGTVLAVPLFAVWCARDPRARRPGSRRVAPAPEGG